MDATVEKRMKNRTPKPPKEAPVKLMKKRGLLGILKGKIHCDDSVFNLD